MLVLFDIDGTLLHAHGVGRRSIEAALSVVARRTVTASGVPFAGRTDPAIARDMLAVSGVPAAEMDGIVIEGLLRYGQLVEEALAESPVTVLPGVEAVLDRLAAEPTVQLALLTGNLQPSAYAKLRSGGLDHYFPFGAFGSDDPDRYRLPPVALRRALEFSGRAYRPQECVIVGDTEHDVGCGRESGMLTVGVCTGPHDRTVLESHGADVVLRDLAAAGPLFRLLGLDS